MILINYMYCYLLFYVFFRVFNYLLYFFLICRLLRKVFDKIIEVKGIRENRRLGLYILVLFFLYLERD